MSLYDFRHMFATMMLTEGHDPAAVAVLMGHGGLQITMRVYHHLHPERARNVIESAPDLLPESIPYLNRTQRGFQKSKSQRNQSDRRINVGAVNVTRNDVSQKRDRILT